jgi:tRNA-Thr(GGU) m(6)t(6)A37 methyltransferase TsaA
MGEEGRRMKVIARVHSEFSSKFGIPRQSGLVKELRAQIIFEPKYRNPDALRGVEGFSHLWLIWEFSQSVREDWSPTVRPPRLGGNERLGVFATRSPFRPNPIGLSCVELERVEWEGPQGPVLHILGADLLDKTPIYDIKPYLPYVEAHPKARGGFAQGGDNYRLAVEIPAEWHSRIPEGERAALEGILAQDPRPPYQSDPERIYGLTYAGLEVKFTVRERQLTVCRIEPST